MLDEKCKFYKDGNCSVYLKRPLDCRMFPLDVIKENKKYYWCAYTTCPYWRSVSKKLVPLIPLLEAKCTKSIFNQLEKFIPIDKEVYFPHKKKKYKRIKEFNALLLK